MLLYIFFYDYCNIGTMNIYNNMIEICLEIIMI